MDKLKKSKVTEITESVQALVGMVGTKLKLDDLNSMCYQHWDCTTTKHSKIESWAKKDLTRSNVVKFCKSSFFKAYPLIFDSSNLDPTKCWMMGIQIAAINVQSTEDDYTLINEAFFSLCNKSGYILKPSHLLKGDSSLVTRPVMRISIEFITGSMLHSLSEKIISEINIKCGVIGSFEDDKNKKYSFNKITEKFINPVFQKERVEFSIYRPDCSFIMLWIYDKSDLIGRCAVPVKAIVNGVRVISIYSNKCNIINSAKILCNVTKDKL